jgi:iron complex transport system ATP-binding protein
MSVIQPVAARAAMSLEGVAFTFARGGKAVDGVCATVPAGRLTAVLGPNGAGKSVLLSLMAGLRRPSAGRVLFAGAPVAAAGPLALAKRVAWVPHQAEGGEDFCVREMVELGRVAFGEPRRVAVAAAGRALEFLELGELADRPIGTLSAGQRRRAMLARALAQVEGVADAVLLLDEPDANLDPAQAVFLFRKLRQLSAGGMAVVAVVHDLHLATEFAEEAWLMRDGQLLAAGTAEDVLTPEKLAQTYGVPVVRGEGLRVG